MEVLLIVLIAYGSAGTLIALSEDYIEIDRVEFSDVFKTILTWPRKLKGKNNG